jgi:hypothetical protein
MLLLQNLSPFPAFPAEDPMIEGVLSAYSVGDYVTANCTSGKSNPAAVLAWQINGVKVSFVDFIAIVSDTIVPPYKHLQRGLLQFSYILNRKNDGNSKHRRLRFQVQHQQIDKVSNKMKEMKRTDRKIEERKQGWRGDRIQGTQVQ